MAKEPTRKQVSKRTWIDADGNKVEDINSALGGRYELLVSGGESIPFTFYPQTDNPATRFTSIFGFFTKVGNEVNAVVNDKTEPGSVQDAAKNVEAFLKSIDEGKWPEREGGPGARVDRGKLAMAIVAYFSGQLDIKPKATRDDLTPPGVEEKLNDNDKLVAQYRAIPAIAAEYRRLTAGEVDEAALMADL